MSALAWSGKSDGIIAADAHCGRVEPRGQPVRSDARVPRHDVRGVVLAGVHAWGDCVLERFLSRPLLPVAGRPLITYTLDWLRGHAVRGVSICANSNTSVLRRRFGDGSRLDLELEYYEDVMPRGPAGCARDAVLHDATVKTLVVVEGTLIPQIDLSDLLAKHEEAGAAVTVVAAHDGPDVAATPLGVFVFSRCALEHVSPMGYQDIKEVLLPRMRGAGLRAMTYAADFDAAPRVTGAATYLAVVRWAVDRLGERMGAGDGYVRVGEGWVHRSAHVDPRARLVGRVVLEPNCVVEANAILVGPTTIGEDVIIGRGAVVSRSVIWQGTRVGAEAVVDQSVVTEGAVVGRGHRCVRMVYMGGPYVGRSLLRTMGVWVRGVLGGRPGVRVKAGRSGPRSGGPAELLSTSR